MSQKKLRPSLYTEDEGFKMSFGKGLKEIEVCSLRGAECFRVSFYETYRRNGTLHKSWVSDVMSHEELKEMIGSKGYAKYISGLKRQIRKYRSEYYFSPDDVSKGI